MSEQPHCYRPVRACTLPYIFRILDHIDSSAKLSDWIVWLTYFIAFTTFLNHTWSVTYSQPFRQVRETVELLAEQWMGWIKSQITDFVHQCQHRRSQHDIKRSILRLYSHYLVQLFSRFALKGEDEANASNLVKISMKILFVVLVGKDNARS